LFSSFDRIHECDRHTDTQTPHDDIGRAYALHRAAKMDILCTHFGDWQTDRPTDGQNQCLKAPRYREQLLNKKAIYWSLSTTRCNSFIRMAESLVRVAEQMQ